MTSFTDSFTRADSTTVGNGWVEVVEDWSIASNRLAAPASGGTGIITCGTAMATDDNSAQVTIAVAAAVSCGVWCRGDSVFGNGYLWRNDGTSWDLFRNQSGSFTVLATFAGAAVNGDVAKIQAVGSTIKAYVNGVERASVTDTGIVTGKNTGLRCAASGSVRYDDFSAADVGGASNVTGTAAGPFGALTGTATGVRKVLGAAASSFGGLAGAASGTRKVIGTAALAGGALTGNAVGLRTVTGHAATTYGGLAGHATAPNHVTGAARGTFGALHGHATAGEQFGTGDDRGGSGGWYELLNIVTDYRIAVEAERSRPPDACPDCGEPLRTNTYGEHHCSFDGSIWEEGPRRVPRSYLHN
ncbi:hypothetical protein [Amycolatopsis sp. NPDC004378]